MLDSVKGIKDIEIIQNQQVIWNGVVRKGIGKENENYMEVIKIKNDIII